MKEHKIQISKTAHYYTLGEPSKETKYFWIACHGYGQLAKKFIYKFDQLDHSKHFIVAPDALSRFYWKREPSLVGSSWMTREDRLDEIRDYANYLSTLYNHFIPQLGPDVKIVLFGFSQGVATCYRWMMEKLIPFDHLIMWAGFVPEDLDYSSKLDYFNKNKIQFIYGTEDEFLTTKRLKWHEGMISEKGLHIGSQSFEGKHVIDRMVLAEVVEKIEEGN